MKLIHRTILRMLPGPLLGWLGTLLFLLLMQFLIRYLPDLVGKGLPLSVIVELIAYNLAYMVVLAVPMSVLIASLMAFGRLAETNAYLVVKSAGVSLPGLIWPVLLIGLLLTGGMWYFNNEILPEANFRAKNLWQDIHRKKPGFQLQPGIFYNGLEGYSMLVQHIAPDSSALTDVLIYDYTEGASRPTVIKAQRGRLQALADGAAADLVLYSGEVHRQPNRAAQKEQDRYERLAFDRLRLRLDLSGLSFERSDPRDGYRSDRTMRTADMVALVDSLERSIRQTKVSLYERTVKVGRPAAPEGQAESTPPLPRPVRADLTPGPAPARLALAGLSGREARRVYDRALQDVRMLRAEIDDVQRAIDWEAQRADRHRVEIHKKYSIAVACLIFMLIGAPLGLSIRRGGLGLAGAIALGIFLFYWVTLVQGEKLADRGFLTPWVGMWIANIVMLIAGLWLMLYATLDLGATPPLRKRLRAFVARYRLQATG